MIKLLKKWHVFHTWSKWSNTVTAYVSYPWTPAGYYAHTQTTQVRECEVCGALDTRQVI